MTAIIRRAKPEDIQTILELTEKIAAFEQTEFRAEGKSEKLKTFLFGEAPRLFCLLAQSENNILGFATYSVEFSLFEADNYLRLNSLFVYEDFRQQGIGKLFITEIKREAVRLNCESIRFFTPQFNTQAVNFYHLLGASSKPAVRFYLDVLDK